MKSDHSRILHNLFLQETSLASIFFVNFYDYYVIGIAVLLGEQENKQKRPVNIFLGLQKKKKKKKKKETSLARTSVEVSAILLI